MFCYTLERPNPIENVTVQDQGSRWALIRWNIPYNGNSEILGYIVYINNLLSGSSMSVNISSDNVQKRQTSSSTSTSYNVTDHILPAMQYQFTVAACNELGCGELGQPSPTLLTDEERKYSFN